MLEKNWTIVRGTEFKVKCTVTINGNPDLTGYVPQAQIRKSRDADDVVASFDFEPSLLDDTGLFDMILPTSITDAIEPGKYYYDVRIVKDAKPIYIVNGILTFITPVTRA